MMFPVALFCALLWILSPTQVWSQDNQTRFPRCAKPTCFALSYRFLIPEQTLGLQSKAFDTRTLLATVGADGLASPEVFGGDPVPPIFDEVVRITFTVDGGEALCTGVALSDDAVLTAGHCGCGRKASYRVAFPRLGNRNLETQFYPSRILARPPVAYFGYQCERLDLPQPGRDLALLFLAPASASDVSGVTPPPAVSPMIPYEMARDGKLKSLLGLGYGRRENGDFPRDLIAAFIRLRDPFCLSDRFDPSGCAVFREFTLSSLVSETDAAADSCDGDSGGPIYYIDGRIDTDGLIQYHRMLVGITSRGLNGVPQFGSTGCGGGGVYTAVAHPDILKWLAVNGVPLEVGDRARHFAERAFPVD